MGFADASRLEHVCLLKKAIYGLRQAPRAWSEQLKGALEGLKFHSSTYDSSFFYKGSGADLILILVYVDDIVITRGDPYELSCLVYSCSILFERLGSS